MVAAWSLNCSFMDVYMYTISLINTASSAQTAVCRLGNTHRCHLADMARLQAPQRSSAWRTGVH